MKQAWNDVKSFATVIMTIGFVAFTRSGLITGDKYYDIFLIIMSFYFGTVYQKNISKNLEKESDKNGNN